MANGPDERGSTTSEMSRWQGRIEARLDAMEKDLLERDKRYDERAEAQNKAVEAALAGQERAVAAALAAAEKAVEVAEKNAEKWRDNANEWRAAMDDKDKKLPTREEVRISTDAITARISVLEVRQERQVGQANAQVVTEQRSGAARQERGVTIGQVIASVAVGVSLLGVVVVAAIAVFAH